MGAISQKSAEFLFSDPADNGDFYLGLGFSVDWKGSWLPFFKSADGSWSTGIPDVFSVSRNRDSLKAGWSGTWYDVMGPWGFADCEKAWGIGAGAGGGIR